MDANIEICSCGACNWAVDEVVVSPVSGVFKTTIHCNVCGKEIVLLVDSKNL